MAFAESDLATFFSDFGEDGTLAGAPVRGNRGDGYEVAHLGVSGMATTGPWFSLASSSVPAAAYGLPLVVPGWGNFTVAEAQPNGSGVTRLILERAP